MLKTLTTLHTPELLHVLASMGHGDDIAIVDAHFPAVSMAQRLVRLDAAPAPEVLKACLQLMPLDNFVEQPALRMEMVGQPSEIPEVQSLFQEEIDSAEGRSWPMGQLERFAFYEHSQQAYAIVATGEQRPYGCILLKKGVVGA